ncbi:MAG: hypothetical protein WBD16_04095 [Pyrinomonadaceae bacterium]
MKNKTVRLLSLVLFAFTPDCPGQMVSMMPFGVQESALVEKIGSLRSANPQITPAELAKSANDLLTKHGIAYKVYFDSATCQKIRGVKQSQKDPKAPIKLGASLQSTGAEKASLALPQPVLTTPECGDCYVEMAILEMTETDFVTLIQGHNIKFNLPQNFSVNKIHLLDNNDVSKKVRTWRVPFRAAPIGVTQDQSVIYLGFENPVLSALSLAVFESGVFEITTRAEAEEGGAGKPDKTLQPVEPGTHIVRFDRWKTKYLLSYKPSCAN